MKKDRFKLLVPSKFTFRIGKVGKLNVFISVNNFEDSDIDLTRYFLSEASQAVDEFLFSKFKKNQRGDYNE